MAESLFLAPLRLPSGPMRINQRQAHQLLKLHQMEALDLSQGLPEGFQALGDVSRLVTRFKSKTEERWALEGKIFIGADFGAAVIWSAYEPLSLHLSAESYTPDFVYLLADGRLILVEVKGSARQQNYRDARSKLRSAANIFSFWNFLEVRWDRKAESWNLEHIRPDRLANHA